MYQQIAFAVSISLIAVLAAAFIHVARHSGREGDGADIAAATGRWRTRLLWGMTLACTPIVAYTLTDLPYARKAIEGLGAIEVQATGHQWYWEVSKTELPVGKAIEFQVTSADVNHGFAIYDTDMRLVTQTQGMPGVVNVLRHTFERPGTYRVLCLEYCGVAHHGMMAELHVGAQ